MGRIESDIETAHHCRRLNTCQQCGACCAHFRVSFYWAEAEELGLPEEAVRKVSNALVCLTGTDRSRPRCHALDGQVGVAVTCTRYAQRPSPCHELQPGDEKCNRARAAHGLPVIATEDMLLRET